MELINEWWDPLTKEVWYQETEFPVVRDPFLKGNSKIELKQKEHTKARTIERDPGQY